MYTSTIRAYQDILTTWRFGKPNSWSEEFAIKRFNKKLEVPNDQRANERKQQCWDRWLDVDSSLPNVRLPSKEWYVARESLHKWLAGFRLGDVDITGGSEFNPTRGHGSIEAKLSKNAMWTCTVDNFDGFAKMSYQHKALKRAVKKRFKAYITRKGLNLRAVSRYLYIQVKENSTSKDLPFEVFKVKLRQITELTHGSRFIAINKNNEKDRPGNCEPFGNILVQKSIGSGIRKTLNSEVGIDLDQLQHSHRVRIANLNIATIDLSDASDSVTLALCEFLLPKHVYKLILQARSAMVLGLDGCYYIPKKVSSMGNGFTFELMSMILTAICRTLDVTATVYGDDIIISKDKAERLIQLLNEVGFSVNEEKSFIDGPFRESCGANWHSEEGYVSSFDFTYPTSIHDCIVIYNKVMHLSQNESYGCFKILETALRRTIPPALRGEWTYLDKNCLGQVTGSSPKLSGYFRTPKPKGDSKIRISKTKFMEPLRALGYREIKTLRYFYAFRFVSELRTPCLRSLKSHQWAKYEMYLSAGRVARDEIRGSGEWVPKLMLVVDGAAVFEAANLHIE